MARSQSAKWAANLRKPYRFKVVYGGRAGGKSTEFAKALVQQMVREPLRICVVRAFKNSIGESNKTALETQIKQLGYEHFFRINNASIDCPSTGSHVFFLGWNRNTSSIRGLEAVDILWIDEGQYLSETAWEEIEPTVRKANSEIWISFNPTLSSDIVWVEFCANTPPANTFLHQVNYTDNRFVSPETVATAERARKLYPDRYRHVWLGELDDTSEDHRRVLPAGYVDHCIREAPDVFEFPEWEFKYRWQEDPVRAGIDIADEGADESSLVIRQGPVVIHASKFGADVESSCAVVYDLCKQYEVRDLWYDAIGIGTGVRDRFRRKMPCKNVVGVNNGGKIFGRRVRFDEKQFNEELFYRRNSQLGWNLHIRAEQTRISLLNPDLPVDPRRQLYFLPTMMNNNIRAEFIQPLWFTRDTGHIRINKKPKGSLKSPDAYDALALAFAHDIRNGLRSGGRHILQDGTDLERRVAKAA